MINRQIIGRLIDRSVNLLQELAQVVMVAKKCRDLPSASWRSRKAGGIIQSQLLKLHIITLLFCSLKQSQVYQIQMGWGGAGKDTSFNGRKKHQIIWGSYFKTIILELAIYNKKLLHLPYLECFLFSQLGPEHSVQLFSLLQILKFFQLELLASTFVLLCLTIIFG